MGLILILWILITFIIGMAYKGILQALLIIPKINIPFTNIEEMVNQDKVKWTMARGTIFLEALEVFLLLL